MFKIKVFVFISMLLLLVNIEIVAVLPDSVVLPFPTKYNYTQTKNDCGPYSVFAVMNYYGFNRKIEDILKDFKDYRLKNNYSLPTGLEKSLVLSGLKIDANALYFRDAEFRMEKIKSHLAAGRPVIILVGIKNYQHYITLFGYGNDVFYVYDSLYRADENGKNPGNRDISFRDFLIMWSNGGMYSLYKYYMLTAFR